LTVAAGPVAPGMLSHLWFALPTGSPAIDMAPSLPEIVEDYVNALRDAHPDAGGPEYGALRPFDRLRDYRTLPVTGR
jgi:hypothetical protein